MLVSAFCTGLRGGLVTAQGRPFLEPIGVVRSPLKSREQAPLQGSEGAPDAWIDVKQKFRDGLDGVEIGQEIIILTWLHRGRRDVLKVHPRMDLAAPTIGVFATRSPDRPNPIGVHRVRVFERLADKIRVGPLEAIDGTPIVDIKAVLDDNEA
jgi:tRNA-Thr(GGU) m(6)t(6)A37 methyltransferase TsaA